MQTQTKTRKTIAPRTAKIAATKATTPTPTPVVTIPANVADLCRMALRRAIADKTVPPDYSLEQFITDGAAERAYLMVLEHVLGFEHELHLIGRGHEFEHAQVEGARYFAFIS